jgi:threonine aldolase
MRFTLMQRRTFMKTPMLVALSTPFASALAYPLFAAAQPAASPSSGVVLASGDGLALTPAEYSALLNEMGAGVEPDDYSLGGVVAELERKVAEDLGKETAVWISTGTLANHLAVRLLAGSRRRVIVQKESHLYNDSGDCCETLSGLDLVPLAADSATFSVDDLEREYQRGDSSRVAVPIGAIQIESPVRRMNGEVFPLSEMRKVSQWARERQIGLHLDGARLYIASAYSGVSVREYATLFDTVYISMYKYFNAASGAVLAGPRYLLENLFHQRRMFGNGLNQVWPFAAVALHNFAGFPERFARAVAASEKVIAALEADSRFELTRISNGTNIFLLRVKDVDPSVYQRRASEAGLVLRAPINGSFHVRVNETWSHVAPQQITARFQS